MIKYNLLSFCLILSIYSTIPVFSQSIQKQSINSTGNSFLQNNMLIRQTIGQSSGTETFSGNELVLRQGFQQPLQEIGLKYLQADLEDFKAYPNPVDMELHLLISAPLNTYSVKVDNILGQQVYETTISPNIETTIHSGDWIPGIYLISIYSSNRLLGVKRIIKN